MTQITVEYMIMIPVMILQIFLFPYVAVLMMDNWTSSRQTIELQQTAAQIGSTVQQMYYTINRVNGSASMEVNLDIPPIIDNHAYTVTLSRVANVDSSYKVMNVSLRLISLDSSASSIVTLGNNIVWTNNLSFNSTNNDLRLTATRTADIITLTLGGT